MGSFVMASLHRGTQILWQRDGIFSYSYFYNHNKTYCQFCQSYITLVCAPHSPTQLRTWFKKYFIDTLHKAACIAWTKQHFNKINTVGHNTWCNNRHWAADIVIFPMWILTRTLARIHPAITGGRCGVLALAALAPRNSSHIWLAEILHRKKETYSLSDYKLAKLNLGNCYSNIIKRIHHEIFLLFLN